MLEKPKWLYQGAKVYADGKVAKVVTFSTMIKSGKTFVTSVTVKFPGHKFTKYIHPNQIQEKNEN